MPVGYSIYVQEESPIHSLDPRSKLFGLVAMFAIALLFNHPLPILALLIGVLMVGKMGNIRIKTLIPFLLASSWFVILGIFIWPFYIEQGPELFIIWNQQITLDGVLFGLAMGLRVSLMMMTAVVVMMTTSPQKLMVGLMKIGLPHKAGIALSTAIRFVPLINSERVTITEAQRTRGLNLEEGSAFSKAIKYIGVIGPLMLRTFDLMMSLSLAMDCRGFGAKKGRTSIISINIDKRDKYIFAAFIIVIGLGILARITGIGILLPSYL